jgi:hypothetical protein
MKYQRSLESIARIANKPTWRIAEYADGETEIFPKRQQKAGDIFTGRDGRRWQRYTKADGSLGVKPF